MATSAWAPLLRLAEAGAPFHIVDTETTGLSPSSNRVIELATVTLQAGRIVNRFETFVNPGVAVPARITEITGITGAMLEGAPRPEEAYQAWREYLGTGGAFVAHNVSFDWEFLRTEFAREQLQWPFEASFCTVRLARHCLPRLRRHGLGALIEHFGIQVSDRHRAMADVEATAELFLKFLAQLQGKEPAEPMAAPAAQTPEARWEAMLQHVKAESNATAALLAQHGKLVTGGADGALILKVTPVYKPRFSDAERFAVVEAAARAVFGEGASVTLED